MHTSHATCPTCLISLELDTRELSWPYEKHVRTTLLSSCQQVTSTARFASFLLGLLLSKGTLPSNACTGSQLIGWELPLKEENDVSFIRAFVIGYPYIALDGESSAEGRVTGQCLTSGGHVCATS